MPPNPKVEEELSTPIGSRRTFFRWVTAAIVKLQTLPLVVGEPDKVLHE
ncbi:MAG: hypothetical protein R3351_00725 [Nitrospirales bacterium]|nr:hypothetical protein [Nitrospirales bacterium]